MNNKNKNTTLVIKPKKGIFSLDDLVEIWRYRDLFYILSERDIKIKYKQTIFGIAWVLFQPLFSTAIFTLLFSRFSSFPTDGLPYPVFAFSGLIYWTFFSNTLTSISGSLQGSEGIIKKVYFPRIIVPASTLVANVADFMVGSIVFFIFILVFKVTPNFLFFASYFIGFLVIVITVLGTGLFLSALNVRYRDVRFILPFFIQILIFLTPVFYPLGIVSPANRWILALNPMTTVIETNRAILTGQTPVNYAFWGLSLLSTIITLLVGYAYFKSTEEFISDIL